ncbi:RGase A [Aspergillus ibericus CBS 121593]|uniref:RGase A n=1 Tax=Aspergillus ibericus CBS 121593 TaxID=1448316 RepID=A0A395GL46_9EURO|nr:RGase A [Aspergillus ibericus CBS 121593]RAK96235.1 RGase A [Aspergillus ibericus CBS 121593]
MHFSFPTLAILGSMPFIVQAQLTGHVGPTTSATDKAAVKTCNVLDYGAVADNTTDVGQPIMDAFTDCASGGLVYVPEGDYLLINWVGLVNGTGVAVQLDGVLYRGSDPGSQGYMFSISDSSDIEFFSSTGKGAIQASGYLYHLQGTRIGPRILSVGGVTDWSVHDLALVDAPMFHFGIGDAYNGEVYNMAIRGGDSGGLDGIDVAGSNIWVHDVMVTNKDECVTIKTGAANILVENIYCNISGGCGMGSLGAGANVTDITYRNVYTWSSNNMYLIKSNGGSGTVSNVLLENFIGHGNAYSLDLNAYWSSMSAAEGDGVYYTNITFSNWTGTEYDGARRAPIFLSCPAEVPCTDITVEEVNIWTEVGDEQTYFCGNAYGTGVCLNEAATPTSYASTITVTSAPSGYSATKMAEDLSSGFGYTLSIPIPTLPASFYPGVTPYSAIAGSS